MITLKERIGLEQGLKDLFTSINNTECWKGVLKNVPKAHWGGFAHGFAENLADIAKLTIYEKSEEAVKKIREQQKLFKVIGSKFDSNNDYVAGYSEGCAYLFLQLGSYLD